MAFYNQSKSLTLVSATDQCL